MAENNTIVVPIGLSGVNAFLIKGKRSVLVDTGLSKDSSVIMERISSLGVDPNDISLILLTHCHYDHCGNASYLKKMIGAKVAVHKRNADALKNGTNEEITPFGFKGKLADLLAKLLMPEQPFEGVTPDILIDEEMNLEDFGIKGRAIFTPGHTPGSISVVLDSGEAIIGDLVNGSPFKGPLFASDIEESRRSFEKIMSFNPKKIYVSHGGIFDPEMVRRMLK